MSAANRLGRNSSNPDRFRRRWLEGTLDRKRGERLM
jgi:hypothetical protein